MSLLVERLEAEALAHAVRADHLARDLCRHRDVLRGTGRYFAGKHLFRDPAAAADDELAQFGL